MDDRKPAIFPDELSLPSASGGLSAVVESPPAALTESREPVAPERQGHSEPPELRQTDSPDGDLTAVYCGSEENVARGFLIALRAMGVAGIEPLSEPSKPLFGRAKP